MRGFRVGCANELWLWPTPPHAALLTALLAVGCGVLGCQKRSEYQPLTPPTLSSAKLSGTAIVPTLDTPLAESGSVVWCATFQVAWNRAKDDVLRGPLRIANAQPVADRLNGSPVTEVALPPGSYYTAAGRLEDGILATIHRQMARQFPRAKPPTFDDAAGFVTYAYLDRKATFTMPFVDTKQPIQFTDADGTAHSVSGFGLHEGTDWNLLEKQAAQVKVLFSQAEDESHPFEPTAFAIDLTADQAEQQVIVAVLPRAEQLRAALDDLARRIEDFAPDEHQAKLYTTDGLAVPNVAFNVDHEFAELQGVDKLIENQGEFNRLFILKAWQSISFRLDKSGAAVISESGAAAAAVPRRFIVDRPFLIVMKRRSADQPYFVAWIENAELLEVSRADVGAHSAS